MVCKWRDTPLRKQGRVLSEPPQSVCSIHSFLVNKPALAGWLLCKRTLMCTATRSSWALTWRKWSKSWMWDLKKKLPTNLPGIGSEVYSGYQSPCSSNSTWLYTQQDGPPGCVYMWDSEASLERTFLGEENGGSWASWRVWWEGQTLVQRVCPLRCPQCMLRMEEGYMQEWGDNTTRKATWLCSLHGQCCL